MKWPIFPFEIIAKQSGSQSFKVRIDYFMRTCFNLQFSFDYKWNFFQLFTIFLAVIDFLKYGDFFCRKSNNKSGNEIGVR